MKNVSRILPCYSADTAGVCSALYELGGLVVTHDASGCNSTYATHDEPRWYDMQSKMYISALTEMDAIMGDDEKFISDVCAAAADQNPEFIAVCGSPMPMMIGTDFDAAAAEIERRSGIRTFGLHTNGTHSYIGGASEALLDIVKEYVRETPSKTADGVNILGMTPLDFPWRGTMESIRTWLAGNGLRLVSCLAMDGAERGRVTLDEIRQAASARVNLVVSYSGFAAAEYLRERFGIPYVCGVPYGSLWAEMLGSELRAAAEGGTVTAGAAGDFGSGMADHSGELVIIGEGIASTALSAAVFSDTGIRSRVICPLPVGDNILPEGSLTVSSEEEIEAALKELRPERVIADPLYKYVLPEGTQLVPLPHFAFSGRCFERDMKDIINTDLTEFLT